MRTLVTANLGLRFLLELAALAAIATWGFATPDDTLASIALGLGAPAGAAVIWGVFRVPNDPGDAPVRVPGPVRLLIELVVWSGATAALIASDRTGLAGGFAALVVFSNAVGYERLGRLARNRPL